MAQKHGESTIKNLDSPWSFEKEIPRNTISFLVGMFDSHMVNGTFSRPCLMTPEGGLGRRNCANGAKQPLPEQFASDALPSSIIYTVSYMIYIYI